MFSDHTLSTELIPVWNNHLTRHPTAHQWSMPTVGGCTLNKYVHMVSSSPKNVSSIRLIREGELFILSSMRKIVNGVSPYNGQVQRIFYLSSALLAHQSLDTPAPDIEPNQEDGAWV